MPVQHASVCLSVCVVLVVLACIPSAVSVSGLFLVLSSLLADVSAPLSS